MNRMMDRILVEAVANSIPGVAFNEVAWEAKLVEARAILTGIEEAGYEIESKAMRDTDRAFNDLAVKQRDHAWVESARHKRERDAALEVVARLTASVDHIQGIA